jgi:hypothetical protein
VNGGEEKFMKNLLLKSEGKGQPGRPCKCGRKLKVFTQVRDGRA